MKFPILLAGIFAVASLATAAPEPGKPAPEFTLKDSNGTEHSLADFKGKTVILEWNNFGCPFVKKFYGSGKMQEFQKMATDDGAVWLTICSSAEGKQGYLTPEEANAKIESEKMNSTAFLLDPDGTVGKAYNAKTTPEIFIINGEGTLVYMGAIDDKKSANPDDIADATNYVKTTLASLKAGEPVEPASTTPYGCSVKY